MMIGAVLATYTHHPILDLYSPQKKFKVRFAMNVSPILYDFRFKKTSHVARP